MGESPFGTKIETPLNTSEVAGSGLPVDNVHALLEGGRYMWIGTFLGGLSRYDKVTGDIKTYENKEVDEVSVSSKMIYSLFKEDKERLWVGTQRGLFIFNMEKESFQSLLPDIFGNQFIYDIQQDSKGRIWVALMNSGTLYSLKMVILSSLMNFPQIIRTIPKG